MRSKIIASKIARRSSAVVVATWNNKRTTTTDQDVLSLAGDTTRDKICFVSNCYLWRRSFG